MEIVLYKSYIIHFKMLPVMMSFEGNSTEFGALPKHDCCSAMSKLILLRFNLGGSQPVLAGYFI